MQHNPDFSIKALIIESDRPGHISKHEDMTVAHVLAVLDSDSRVAVDAKEGRLRIIGPTEEGIICTVVIGAREAEGVYGLVTARRASRPERAFYKAHIGEERHD